jgi:hypothetical protein
VHFTSYFQKQEIQFYARIQRKTGLEKEGLTKRFYQIERRVQVFEITGKTIHVLNANGFFGKSVVDSGI